MSSPVTPPTVASLKGVGPALELKLEKLGIRTVADVLLHLPLRYEDRTRITAIGSLLPKSHVLIEGEVELAQVHLGRRRSLLVVLSDGTGQLTLRFFHFAKAQQQAFAQGSRWRCFGEVRPGPKGLEMVHPEFSTVAKAGPLATHLTAVYPSTEGVGQTTLRKLIGQAKPLQRPEWWQAGLMAADAPQAALPLLEALQRLHEPAKQSGPDPVARQRVVLDELVAHSLSMRMVRAEVQAEPAPALSVTGRLSHPWLLSLPFTPTAAQTRVMAEISTDLTRSKPMLRLLQGDVGAGKTLVAAAAILQALEAGFQAALMAPTELLAEQHRRSFSDWFELLGLDVLWLASKMGAKQRRAALARLAEPEPLLVVGTHALFQDEVMFGRLGLVVIDEQHRFGVHQRLALRAKGKGLVPHQLVMTATPIPRTLAMVGYADLDVSIIDELPPGRTPVTTVAINAQRRAEVIARVQQACRQQRQAYWVCPLVEESEVLQCEAAETSALQLQKALPELRIGLVHGRMKAEEKEQVMAAFKAHELDVLVATTVIEVGVDVPNASLMIIENAERMGLAQLHQLRGRVGRGAAKSHTVLLYGQPLSKLAQARLAMMRDSNDGFAIAEKDLELRGPGELLGTRQTGLMQFKVADLARDEALLEQASDCADKVLARSPAIAQQLLERWIKNAEQYVQV